MALIPSSALITSDVTSGLQSIQVLTTSGTWTKPDGIRKIFVRGVAGGGSGGGGNTGTTYGAGGGAGGYFEKIIDVSDITYVEVTIGAGGARQTTANTDGNPGGSTSFGSYASATGGSGGGHVTSSRDGGVGGTATGGDLNLSGGAGQGARAEPALGGISPFGGAGMGTNSGTVNIDATGFGCGGSGSCNNFNDSGAGADGVIIVQEYAG